jgi:hypothetical protein
VGTITNFLSEKVAEMKGHSRLTEKKINDSLADAVKKTYFLVSVRIEGLN